MKKYLILIALIALICRSCKEEDKQAPSVTLNAPAYNAEFNLSVADKIAFSWTSGDVTDFRLVLSLTETLNTPEVIPATGNAVNMPASSMDNLLRQWGVPAGEKATVYWTVLPGAEGAIGASKVRKILVKRKIDPEGPPPPIALTAPVNNTYFDLSMLNKVSFTWSLDNATSGNFRLYLATRSDLSNALTYPVVSSMSWEPSSVVLNNILIRLGVAREVQQQLYWKVEPMDYTVSATESAVGTLQMKRMDGGQITGSPLLSPANDTAIVLNHLAPSDNPVTFQWEAVAGISSYDLVLSYENDLSNPLSISRANGISTASVSFDHAELQALIQQGVLKKRYKDNVLYWNVKESGTNDYISETPYLFHLGGYRQFVDTRGDETIVYDISVITYNDKQHVWLSQNLRTEKAVDGTPISEIDLTGYATTCTGGGCPALALDYATNAMVEEECGFWSPEVAPFVGPYYSTAAADVWKDKLVPSGWKIPTFTEWVELFDAAAVVSADCRVLKHPAGYPDTYAGSDQSQWNAWQMNMIPNGCANWKIYPCGGSSWGYAADGKGIYWFIEDVDGNGILFDKWDTGAASKWGEGTWVSLPIRLIYTGDDNN